MTGVTLGYVHLLILQLTIAGRYPLAAKVIDEVFCMDSCLTLVNSIEGGIELHHQLQLKLTFYEKIPNATHPPKISQFEIWKATWFRLSVFWARAVKNFHSWEKMDYFELHLFQLLQLINHSLVYCLITW